MRLNASKHFFFEIIMILGQNLFYVRESQTIFCPIRNVLENPDLGKRHKIWAKPHRPPNCFWLVRLCTQTQTFYLNLFTIICLNFGLLGLYSQSQKCRTFIKSLGIFGSHSKNFANHKEHILNSKLHPGTPNVFLGRV